MKKKEDNYYGIRFNNDIPKIDKINNFSKEVEIKFIGKAYLVKRKDDKIEKVELKNYHKLEKEGTYEIEFINNLEEMYILQVRIEKSSLFFIILFLIGSIVFTMCYIPINQNLTMIRTLLDVIDLSVLEVDIEDEHRYVFDVDFENIVSSDISLPTTMDAKAVSKNKIAPGVDGEFSIIISTKDSTVDMQYSIDFEDITDEKPSNLKFKIKGGKNEYSSLQELEKYLKGIALKETEKEIVIQWHWPYEIDDHQDTIDTDNGRNLSNYKFRIKVNGEEAIK